jgi:hypothetical protein
MIRVRFQELGDLIWLQIMLLVLVLRVVLSALAERMRSAP